MIPQLKALALFAVVIGLYAASAPQADQNHDPQYTSDGQMKLPEDYRSWVYLTTGFDMSYTENPMAMGHHMFDNVFVNPESYAAFLKTGTWPDKTTIVLEGRMGQGKGSINKAGQFQAGAVMGLEVHVKDSSRFKGDWAFFGFGDSKVAKMTSQTASCYSCHSQHAAVDTTFVQFYPTLLPVAKEKKTLSAAYLKEMDK